MDPSNLIRLRDRALVAVMAFSFARVSAVVNLKVEDYYPQKKRWWLRLRDHRRVWLAPSADEGRTFEAETPVAPAETGACGCYREASPRIPSSAKSRGTPPTSMRRAARE